MSEEGIDVEKLFDTLTGKNKGLERYESFKKDIFDILHLATTIKRDGETYLESHALDEKKNLLTIATSLHVSIINYPENYKDFKMLIDLVQARLTEIENYITARITEVSIVP